MISKEKVISILENAKYKFAKTASTRNPHWYSLSDTWKDRGEFEEVVQFIRNNGKVERFWKVEYMCFHYKGWKWWTMGAPLSETILINKTYASESYNKIAYKYDDLFTSKEYKEENQEIVEMLKPHLYDVGILDIGSGTGLLLDLFTIDPKFYVGIDPSFGMFKQAKLKHPYHKFHLDKLETYIGYTHIAISLFGCMNYVLPDYLKRINDVSKRHFLMFYKPKYNPVTYDISNVEMFPFRHTKAKLKKVYPNSDITEWKNYYIVTNLRE